MTTTKTFAVLYGICGDVLDEKELIENDGFFDLEWETLDIGDTIRIEQREV